MSFEQDKQTLIKMFSLYCKAQHKPQDKFCRECNELLNYSLKRLQHCPYGENKPMCKDCTAHCYHPKKRELVKAVMRYAGPRMLYYHPVSSIKHYLEKILKTVNQEKRSFLFLITNALML